MVEDTRIVPGHDMAFCAWSEGGRHGFRLMPDWDVRRLLLKGPGYIRAALFDQGRSAAPEDHFHCLNGLLYEEAERRISIWCPSHPGPGLALLLGIAGCLYPDWQFSLQPLGHEAFIRALRPDWENSLWAVAPPTPAEEIETDPGTLDWEGGPGTLYIEVRAGALQHRIFSESATDLLRRSPAELEALFASQPPWPMPDQAEKLQGFIIRVNEGWLAYDPNPGKAEWEEAREWHSGLRMCDSGWLFLMKNTALQPPDFARLTAPAISKIANWLQDSGEPEASSALACIEQIGS